MEGYTADIACRPAFHTHISFYFLPWLRLRPYHEDESFGLLSAELHLGKTTMIPALAWSTRNSAARYATVWRTAVDWARPDHPRYRQAERLMRVRDN